MWLRNCWYVIAWDHEIPPADSPQLFTRTVLGEPVLVYRTQAGDLIALEDRCCHRHAPLSVGKREGDCVRCGYHGLKFDHRGQCVEAPGIEIVPAKARVRRYPLVLKNRWVFVWMGDPALADDALLPDNFSCDSPDWQHKPGYLHYDTPYLLICDNLLDFSHLSFVHEKTLGGSTRIAQARPTIEPVPGPNAGWPQIGIKVSRHVHDVPAPPFYQRFRRFDTNLDRWFVYDFLLPGTLLMHSGGRPTGTGPDQTGPSVRLHSCQTLTPETAITRDLLALPPPKGKIAVAVYGIRDQTGQYKPAPDSSFSTAVTQGASSMLIRALQDSGWFIPVERENLQNLLTERKIVRALEMPQPAGTPAVQIPRCWRRRS